ncbi:hypothetical protein J1N35_030363 [Gossypium stocksii]|uniref:Uncharacterized protein n=1 Tax=Gossypium stocksii TaxID=47602 RepID=A0A9D3ZSW8_9ROSI|nr:hypothetical protein J1N35_030363 [Gossypium stocksii]
MSAFVNICMSHKSGNLVAKLMANEGFKDENCTFSIEETPKEKLPNYVVPDLTDFKLKPYVFQCPRDIKTAEAAESAK